MPKDLSVRYQTILNYKGVSYGWLSSELYATTLPVFPK